MRNADESASIAPGGTSVKPDLSRAPFFLDQLQCLDHSGPKRIAEGVRAPGQFANAHATGGLQIEAPLPSDSGARQSHRGRNEHRAIVASEGGVPVILPRWPVQSRHLATRIEPTLG